MFKKALKATLWTLFGLSIVAIAVKAAPYPLQQYGGGTGTNQTSSIGQVPIGNGAGSYTPANLTPGANIQITNGSGTITIAVTGIATGTVYLLTGGHGISLSPSSITASGTISVNTSTIISDVVTSGQFLPSSTIYVATVNGQSGAVTLGIPATTTINSTQATVFHLVGDGTTVTSTVSGATTTFSIITSGNWSGTWQGVNSSTFYLASNPSGYITTSTNNFGGVTSTITIATTTASGIFNVTSSGNKAFTITLPSNVGFFTNDKGYITSGVATGTIIAGGTATGPAITLATSSLPYFTLNCTGSTCTFTGIPTSTILAGYATSSAAGTGTCTNCNVTVNGNGIVTSIANGSGGTSNGTLSSTTPWTVGNLVTVSGTTYVTSISSSTYYLATNPSNFISTSTGLTVANFASQNISQWTNNSNYLTGNQSISWTGTGDVTGSNSGATTISVALTTVKIQGKNVTSTAPSDHQFLTWVGANSDWEGGSLAVNAPLTIATSTTSSTSITIACATCSTATGANPSASVGLSAVNGSASTFMRSDAAPAINQAATFSFSALGNTTSTGNISATTFTENGSPVPTGTIVNSFNGLTGAVTYAPSSTIYGAGAYLGTSGSNLTVSSTLASSSWKFVIGNATTTNNTTNFSEWQSDTAGKITNILCKDTVGTTSLFFFEPTSYTNNAVSSTILSSFACGTASNTTSTSLSFGIGQSFIVEVSSTVGTPISTPVQITYTKL